MRLAHMLRAHIARGSNGDAGTPAGANPFEFRVLECLLAATVSYFEGADHRLQTAV